MREEKVHTALQRQAFSFSSTPLIALFFITSLITLFFFPEFLLVTFILVLNTAIESYKRLFPFVPFEIEILYPAVALLFAFVSPLAAFSVALIGAAVAEAAHLRSSREILSRTTGLLVTATTLLILPHTQTGLFAAIVTGLFVHYVFAAQLYCTFGPQNYLRRLSTLVLSMYLLVVGFSVL